MKNNITLILCILIIKSLLLGCQNQNNQEDATKNKGIVENMPVKEKYTENYSNGKVKIKGFLIEGKRNGVWKTYNEHGNLIEGSYYINDSQTVDIDVSDYDLRLIKSDKNYFSILLPVTWVIQNNYKEALLLAVKPSEHSKRFSPTINVLRMDFPNDISFEEYINLNIQDIKENSLGFNLEGKTNTLIENKEAYEVYFSVETEDLKLKVLSAYIIHAGYCYLITCISDGSDEEFFKYKDLFVNIINSIKFPDV